jgi:hypothetical protein
LFLYEEQNRIDFFIHQFGDNMRFNRHLIALSCLAAVSGAQAMALGDSGIEFYGNLYPQLQSVKREDGAGSVKSMAPATNIKAANDANLGDDEWLNSVKSYIGLKGSKSLGGTKVGFDWQRVTTQGCLVCETNAGFVYAKNKQYGSVKAGQFDTAYKDYGDNLSFLGISSSNFMSTSSFLSDVTWKSATSSSTLTVPAAKLTNFHPKIGNSIAYETPEFNSFQAMISHSQGDSGSGQSVSAMAVKWEKGPYYASVQTETHNNFHVFATTGSSEDKATRVSFGYKVGKFAMAADFANLDYSQSGITGTKVNGYSTNTSQVSAQYTISSNWRVGANYATNGAGSCTIADGTACNTDGLGGHGYNLGLQYKINKSTAITAIYGKAEFNSKAGSNSSSLRPQYSGGSVQNTAINFQYKF